MEMRHLIGLDETISRFLQRWSITLLRLSIGVVFIWFGALKVFDVTPVAELVANTVYWVNPGWFVPFLGAFEIPPAARVLAGSGRCDAIVTLGSVIRGGTPHFDYVCRGVTDGLRAVMQESDVPVGFGVLTTDDIDQALARAGGSDGNKGGEVALAAVEMAQLMRGLGVAAQGAR